MESLKISVDLKRRTNEVLSLQQGYTYPVELSVFDNGTAYTCTGATAQVHFLKSTGKFSIKTTDITISDNKVSFKLDNTLINRGGVGQLQVVLTKGGDVFGSWAIHCNVFANVIQDEATEDSNIIDVLGDLTKNIAKADPLSKALEKQIPQATPLTNSLKTQIPQATELVNEIRTAIEEGGTVDRRELGDFKKGYTGKEYADLNQRVNGDIDHVQQQINDSSLLPYEGTSIKADNTYHGLTKEATVKGRTLQNLLTEGMFNSANDGWANVLDTTLCSFNNGYITVNSSVGHYVNVFSKKTNLFKPSTTYTVVYDVKENTLAGTEASKFALNSGSSIFNETLASDDYSTKGIHLIKVTTKDDITASVYALRSFIYKSVTSGSITFRFMILEGDHTNTPIEELPFVEGIQSVGENEVQENGSYLISGKSFGKNLFNFNMAHFHPNLIVDKENLTVQAKDENYNDIQFWVYLKKGVSYRISIEGHNLNGTNYQILKGMQTSYQRDELLECVLKANGFTFTHEDGWYTIHTVNVRGTTRNYLLYAGTEDSSYEPYKESNYSYILNEPLRKLPNGVADSINLETGVLTRRVGKAVLDNSGAVTYEINSSAHTETGYGVSTDIVGKVGGVVISDKFVNSSALDERIWLGVVSGRLTIRVSKSKLETANLTGFKKWIGENPVVAYYELVEPIEIQLTPTQLKSFEGATHIVSNNTLQATTSVKIPSNVQMVVQNLRAENKALNVELKDTKAELENTDLDILEMNWETDFRVCELEYVIYSQEARAVSLKNNSRAISKYDQAKTLIEANRYNKTTMTRQLTVYLERGYITEEEYQELIAMME